MRGWSDPGTVNLSPANFYARWEADGSSQSIVVFVQDALLSRVILENWGADPRSVEIVPQFLVRDPLIEVVVTQLAVEAGNGSPSGLLYAESACEFLAHHLIQRYSTLSKTPARPLGGLPAHRLKVVKNYIEENLGNPIALHELAGLACVSVRHFERAFRQSLGVPPHRYVLERRVCLQRATCSLVTPSSILRRLPGNWGSVAQAIFRPPSFVGWVAHPRRFAACTSSSRGAMCCPPQRY